MDNKQKLEAIILGVVGCAVYDGIKNAIKVISVSVPVIILTLNSPQKTAGTSKNETPFKKTIYASEDQVFIGNPSPRMTMPFINTVFTTTASAIAIASGDQTIVKGV